MGELSSQAQEQRLIKHFQELEFKPFEFHGYLGKRRIVSFGWRYDYATERLAKAGAVPPFLLLFPERAAEVASVAAEDLPQALITEYQAGAGIGWHRDKAAFGEVL